MTDPRVIEPTRPEGAGTHYPDGAPAPVPASLVEEHYRALADGIANLAAAVRASKRVLPVDAVATANLDADGNGIFPVYQVGGGFYFNLHRAAVEVQGYDPAAPFTNAGKCYFAFYVSSDPTSVGQGQLIDFTPTVSTGQVFPAIADYADEAGPLIRSEEWLVARVVGGPASKLISVHFQGYLYGQET